MQDCGERFANICPTSHVFEPHGREHGGGLPVRPDTNPPLPPLPPILVSTWLELATWAPTAPGNFF